ncbi:MAG: chromosome segregation protein SMC [Opitutales bacterium]|nr:chromosome segregation protein SMC [Opitutales bacterium]
MFLKELRIQGFKSFADQTLLALKPGITAIVGPNGCGKSNIADALRWVLGEQSTKSLRADAMADVIFQGSTKRKPLSLCEVALTFADCEETLGTSFNELEIARRVTRDGSSDYFINGAKARLKDIQLLFMGTGVGQVSYSFLLQGRIDQILSSNPSERRAIFEEAAGISRYKTQRRDAMDKLRGVEADLARVGDVLDEVTRRIGTLRRQASKAVRYKLLNERAGHLELALSAWERERLAREINEASAVVEGTRTRLFKSRAAMEKSAEQIASLREGLLASEEKLAQARQAVYELQAGRDKAMAAAETAAVRRRDHLAHKDLVSGELSEMDAEKAGLEESARQRKEMRAKLMELFGQGDGALDERARELQEARKELEETEQELSSARQRQIQADSALARQRTLVARLDADLEASQERSAALAEEMRLAADELSAERREQEQVQSMREQLEERRDNEAEALQRAKTQAQSAVASLEAVRKEIRELERTHDSLCTRANMLEELQKRMEGFSGGAKAILQGKLSDAVPSSAQCALLMETMDVEERWTGAVEMLLGSGIDALTIDSAQDAESLRDELMRGRHGQACLILPPQNAAHKPVDATDMAPQPLAALDVIRARRQDSAPVLQSLFSQCWLFETLADFLACREANPGWRFAKVATLDGCTVDACGMVTIGHGGERKDSFLLRQSQIRSLREEAAAKQDLLAALGEREDEADESARRATGAVNAATQALAASDQELALLRGQERGTSERMARAAARMETRRGEQQRIEAGRMEAERKILQAREELEAIERATKSGGGELNALEEAIAVARSRTEDMRTSYEALRMEHAGRKQRLEMAHREVAEVERMLQEWTLRRQRRESDSSRHAEQISTLEAEIEDQQALAAKMQEELEGAHKVQEQRRDETAAAQRHVHALEQDLAEQRKGQDELADALTKQEVALVKLNSSMEFLAEEVEREHSLKLENVDWREQILLAGEAPPERLQIDMDDEPMLDQIACACKEPTAEEIAAVPLPDWADIKAQAYAHRERIDALGAINLLAIEEYQELRERHSFLKTQSDDLWQAREKLLAAIEEINKSSMDLFRNTFLQIQANFRYTFETLFGGGEASVELVDSDDPLEAGVEINARPPGTRLRSIALLSGGQKTMTAMALLFAIYMVKPSPFCVLDEIDAPLDEANVSRFSNMLERFLDHSQFFIITHNKHTIARANTIYGVTMEERGVSRVLSMRMDRKDEARPEDIEALLDAVE